MTERDDDRIDLTVLRGEDSAQADAVVQAAMMRIKARAPSPEPLLADLAGWWRPGLAAAVLLLALGLVLARQRTASESGVQASVEARVLDWAESGYVPSNGELLATFQGFSR
jgi:hypothetical protein